MTSFFFNITEQRYKRSRIFHNADKSLERVDISSGIVFVEGVSPQGSEIVSLHNLDRMAILLMSKRGSMQIQDHHTHSQEAIAEGQIAIYVSSDQQMTLRVAEGREAEVFILFVADFFLKRYLSGDPAEPIDYLYRLLQEEKTLECISLLPLDAMSLYSVSKLQEAAEESKMQSMRAEHRVVEFMMHRFMLLDIVRDGISPEELALAVRAKEILLRDFVTPPTIETLAHLCATNASKLKKVFKKVHQSTIHSYIQRLRMEAASLMLKEEQLTIGEIAKKVGYRHQGHFSKRFYETYGIYPKMLRQ